MATIKTGLGTGVIAVLAADTTILDITDRVTMSGCVLHNTNTVQVVITCYISPDLTSASGKVVDKITMAADDTLDVGGIIGNGYASPDNIIFVGDLTGVNATTTYTQYIGASV